MSHDASSATRLLLREDSFGRGNDDVANDLIVHAVFAVEIFHMGEMLCKLGLAVDQRTAVSEALQQLEPVVRKTGQAI